MSSLFPRVSTFKTPGRFRERLAELGVDLPCDDQILTGPDSPLGQALEWDNLRVANRWTIHPMEGWDGTLEGLPSEFTHRRWRNFGLSGAKFIWGGEAVAVRHDGRANPNQLLLKREFLPEFDRLRQTLVDAHIEKTGSAEDLVIGLQLTHSGRFCKPDTDGKLKPRILFRHPVLDRRFGIDSDDPVLSDEEIRALIPHFVEAARMAAEAGFDFVDLKHCHGYLGHEFLGAHTRPGPYGGSLENRMRFLREMVEGIREKVPQIGIGVRLSAFDFVPYKPNPEETTEKSLGRGTPDSNYSGDYVYGFSVDPKDPTHQVMDEGIEFVRALIRMGIRMVNVTGGSPYYNPHIQRPAYFPPSDGYQPPEDPVVGVARLLNAAKAIKQACPEAIVVGTGFTYLQDFLPHVAQAVVREGWMDLVGIGRMVLAYPELPFDSLVHGELDRKKICRTFSDCTTAPRKGLISGCYPLDPYYKALLEGETLRALKMR